MGRWGGWPPWSPLLVRTLSANPTITFLLLSESPPAAVALPPNVEFHALTLDALLARLQRTVGVSLRSLGASGQLWNGVSSAKVNDFKPMWGEAFAPELRRFQWWGYIQEDVLLGDLRRVLTPALLTAHDVVCPFDRPLNASGVFMLLRNAPQFNRVWRLSRDAPRVLSSPSYQTFDEWWGAAKDGMPAVLGREAAAGRIRLSTGPARAGAMRWMGDDTSMGLVACWQAGSAPALYVNAGAEGPPCAGLRGRAASRQVAIFHMAHLKHAGALSNMSVRGAAIGAVARAREFALTREGFWVAADATDDADEGARAVPTRYVLLSGLAPGAALFVNAAALRQRLLHLSSVDSTSRCKKGCAAVPAAVDAPARGATKRPCIESCEGADGVCKGAIGRLRASWCAAEGATAVQRAEVGAATPHPERAKKGL